MNLLQSYKNWRNAPKRAKITPKRIIGMITAYRNYRRKYEKHIREQIAYRRKHSRSACINTNLCPCGCEWNKIIYWDLPCDEGCWPAMMNEKEWKEFKKNK